MGSMEVGSWEASVVAWVLNEKLMPRAILKCHDAHPTPGSPLQVVLLS